MKLIKIISIAIFVSFLGCSIIRSTGQIINIKNLKVNFEKVEIKGVDLQGIDTYFYLNIKNPNSVDVKVLSFDFDALFNNKKVATGSLKKEITISSGGHREIIVPIHIPFSGLSSSLKSAILTKSVEAGISGYVNIGTPLGKLRFKVLDKTRRII